MLDKESESFQQFDEELRGKLSSKLYDKIEEMRKDVASSLSERVNGEKINEDVATAEMLAAIACFFVTAPIALDYADAAADKMKGTKVAKKIGNIVKKSKPLQKLLSSKSSFSDGKLKADVSKTVANTLKKDLDDEGM